MKKLLLILMLAISSLAVNAQVYRANSYAFKYVTNGYWTDWSDWYKCSVLVKLDSDEDVITINSQTPQKYVISNYMNNGNIWTDSSGGENIGFYAYRVSDGHTCQIRLRIETNGNSQIYVEFSDAMWVYNVTKIQ